jgi:Rps23 Pro-64 3,4-dihydroxylase Tpa1-like proline 4-hydroxylase
MTSIAINPALDPDALRANLRERGRLQVPGFFTEECADYLFGLLQKHQHWYLTYNEGQENFESAMVEFQRQPVPEQRRFMGQIYQRARSEFQFVFRQYDISRAIARGENPGHPLHAMHEFMNSAPALEFMRRLTGHDEVARADAYASCYSPGDFLTQHEDLHVSHDRVAAYVVSMTKGWNPDWGGYLAFYDDAGNVIEAFRPAYNVLNIFLIPQQHAVQMVAPFAGHPRTSFLGWLQR